MPRCTTKGCPFPSMSGVLLSCAYHHRLYVDPTSFYSGGTRVAEPDVSDVGHRSMVNQRVRMSKDSKRAVEMRETSDLRARNRSRGLRIEITKTPVVRRTGTNLGSYQPSRASIPPRPANPLRPTPRPRPSTVAKSKVWEEMADRIQDVRKGRERLVGQVGQVVMVSQEVKIGGVN